MINKARNRFSENGHLYLVWGWSIMIITILQFVMAQYHWHDQPNMVWMLTLLPFAYMMIYLRRRVKRQTVRTYTDEIIGYVWMVFSVLMFLSGFTLGSGRVLFAAYPLALALYGMPTFLSGTILRFKPLVAGGIGCWLLCVAAAFTPHQYHILMLSLAVLVAWIIPGYWLQHKYKISQNNNF
jgi:hypothetical protein